MILDCAYRKEATGKRAVGACLNCGGEDPPIYRCERKGRCITSGYADGIQSCRSCDVMHRPPTFPTIKPLVYQPIGIPAIASERGAFNCSLHVDEKPGFYFAFRSNWTSSQTRVCRLNDRYQVVGSMTPLFLLHPRGLRGREDGRLFRYRGEWHLAYVGYEKDEYFCSLLVAKIGKPPLVDSVMEPTYSRRTNSEKNWSFFDHDGELHAVYRIGPGEHRVLRFHGDQVAAEYTTSWEPGWQWGEMRGGASPQIVNGEWYSWFHGFLSSSGRTVYTMGLYTFETTPPFRPLRRIKTPLVVGGLSQMDDKGWRKSIYYPCGAGLKNGRWHISAGEHDSACTVTAFDAAEIERALEPCR